MVTKLKITSSVLLISLLVIPCLVLAQSFDGSETGETGGAGQGWSVERYSDAGLPGGKIYDIIKNLTMVLLAAFGFFGIIGFAISGIMYLTAAGDETQIEKAKKAMMWSIVGIVVGLAGFVIIQAINTALDPGSGGVKFF